jgi:rhamnosyltransferase
MASSKYISVFIPTYNGEPVLAELLTQVLKQQVPKGYELELMVTDSGSKDKTVDIVKSFGDKIKFDEIPNSEFSHGKTRQRAAEKAKGDFILFLSQDATPRDDRWLIHMIEPFFISEKIGCVYGRQIPRPFAPPTIKREVATVFSGLGAPNAITLQREKSLVDQKTEGSLNSFFSDVNSAIRKDLTKVIPFRDINYAEDQALATDMQHAGYLKAYAAEGSVWHSNEYTAKEYYHRKFDEYIGLINGVDYKIKPSYKSLLLGWVKPTLKDWSFTRKDQEYNLRAKIKFFTISPVYNYYAQLGKFMAAKYHGNQSKVRRISLEERRKA